MELSSYFSLVRKYLYIIIIIVLATVIGSFFLVKNLPDEYISHAQIATGIVDASRHLLDKDNPNAQADEINREFSNLTQIIKLKKIIDNVSYQLIIHDLSSPEPFRKLNHQFKNLSDAAVQHALEVYKNKLKNSEPLSLYDTDENGLNQLLISMKYDERSLRKDLDISRDEESDFISVTFTSENPQLSAFVVNTLCKEFINYYTLNIKKNESNAVAFLTNLLEQKRAALNAKKEELQKYKIENGILNLDEQSKAIYAEILTYTDKKLQNQKDLASYDGAIKDVDSHFNPKDRRYIEATISNYNQTITNTEAQLKALNDEYVRSGFNPKFKPALDSLRKELSNQTNLSSDKYITNPMVSKDNLVQKKLDLEVSRDLAEYSVQSIDNQLRQLNAKFARLVPFDATVKTYEFDIDIASKEYLEVLNKYNQTNLQSNFSIKLTQVETATPDVAQPSKKILLIALSGIVSLFLCLLVLFILFYLDDNVREPSDLVGRTQLPLLGSLNVIPAPIPDLKKLWDVENRNKMKKFKELLRSIRFEIDQELKGEKVLAITSLGIGEGKTLVAASLAYAYAAINKKVLLIDGNFNDPTISEAFQPKIFVEEYFKSSSYIEREGNAISVLGNRSGDVTLLEINDEKPIQKTFDDLRARYDIIIIDLPPLDSLNQSKEWMLFANKTIAVFQANKSITRSQYQYIDYLKNQGAKFSGWVLNKTAVKTR
ncbi:MAG: cryptic autophosphorylating protein tyrosine kinase Etk [Mucilaginibacter sp.]|jgi:succinoglycan biosynthesis transport protein ExoP|nr:cryptic autophosphorylating protein tyrosine kinase Etk [Mucilaginibacter sp.]MDB5139430.1 cryptic autophosphorylating protein tyrosine kinase Etk [Mucilaginibacter sp.]